MNCVLPEGLEPVLVCVQVVLVGGGLALSQAVYVKDGHQVVQLVVAGEGKGLPDGSLGALPITDQAVHTVAVWKFYILGL